ncbi:MAG: hypothetical protein ACRD2P_05770 [Terriglobia bacterium]
MPRTKKAPISLEALEVLTKEVITEGAAEYQPILEKMLRTKPGTERHRSLLCDLYVKATILESKAKAAEETIDEYLESLPDDDD